MFYYPFYKYLVGVRVVVKHLQFLPYFLHLTSVLITKNFPFPNS